MLKWRKCFSVILGVELMRRVNKVQRRLVYFIGAIIALIFVLSGRYAWVQLVQGDSLEKRLKSQSGEQLVVQSPRGTILDRNGRELAVSMMTKSLFIDPNHVQDADQLARDLAPLVHLTEEQIKADIAQGGGFVWVKRYLDYQEEKQVTQLISEKNLNCLGFKEESKRFYPNGVLAANVLGFVGTDDIGLDGIEQAFDSQIKGKVEKSFVLTDMKNKPIFDSIFLHRSPSENNCKDVVLTIDSTMQFIVEQALDKAMVENHPQAVTAVVMNPKTGDILAMASRPTYDPNKFSDFPAENWKNRAVSFIYEPGSTFKAVVAAAALQEKLVTPNQMFVDPGYIMVSGRRIQNWSGDSFGTVPFVDVVKQSINTGFVQVGMQVGAERLTSYAKLFGFGQTTGIELPGEEKGLLFDPKEMRDSDLATMSIGQSIAVTPLQLVTAMSAIANDGVLLKPHILKSIQNADGTVFKATEKEEVRRTIDSSTDKTLVSLLEQVVASGGGSKAAVKGYRIAGKTGTAQKIKIDGSGYMDGRYIASFCGFAPVEDPQITVLVMIDDPNGVYYGGQIAAPIAQNIFSQLFRYLHIEPSSDPFAGQPKPEEEREKSMPVITEAAPVVPAGKVLVPDLTGKTMRQAADILADLGLTLDPDGSGVAVSQSIALHSIVDPGTVITVSFKAE
jgi:stage V sporulation protein D (sporulation-specific penicillin-binding protein)